MTLEDGASVWYQAVLSGCRVEEGALIAIRAAVLEGATAGAEAMVGAGAVVPPGGEVPPRTLVLGNPAAPKRAVTEEKVADNRSRVERYAALAQSYRTAAHTPGEGRAD
ncbi:MAG: gamma carbonic anhydrase family protein [Candidatus Methylomirabilales bacterium]